MARVPRGLCVSNTSKYQQYSSIIRRLKSWCMIVFYQWDKSPFDERKRKSPLQIRRFLWWSVYCYKTGTKTTRGTENYLYAKPTLSTRISSCCQKRHCCDVHAAFLQTRGKLLYVVYCCCTSHKKYEHLVYYKIKTSNFGRYTTQQQRRTHKHGQHTILVKNDK